MADGVLLSLSYFGQISASSTYSGTQPIPSSPTSLQEIEKLDEGDATLVDPILMYPVTFSGTILKTFFDSYYNAIWVLPSIVNFGEVPGPETQEFVIWNSYLAPVTLNTIIAEKDENVVLTGANSGEVLDALAITEGVISTDQNGPNQIETIFNFDFGSLGVFTLQVLGTRSAFWPFKVNWSSAYEVNYEYLTDILVSRSGKQQRRSLRSKPRKRITYQSLLQSDDIRLLNGLLATRQTQTFVAAEETEFVKSIINSPAGSNFMQVSSNPVWLQEGDQYLLVYRNKTELRTIEAVNGTDIIFSSVSLNEWPTGTNIHPLLTVRLPTSLGANRNTNGVAQLSVELEVVPGSETAPQSLLTLDIFEGREVMTFAPNWNQALEVSYQYEREEVDYNRGVVAFYTPIDFGSRLHQATFSGLDNASMKEKVDFFTRNQGQRNEFWLPSWEDDFVLVDPISAGSDNIRVVGLDPINYFRGDKVHQCIVLKTKRGEWYYRRIRNMFEIDDAKGLDTIINLDSSLPVDIKLSDLHFVGWLFLARHASDSLTAQWQTNEVGSCNFSLLTLENLPEENL